MTDERRDEPAFDDPAFDTVREQLAAAKVSTPIPADVAARLEATLADLSGRTGDLPAVPEEDGSVVPLRRRSRLAPRLLAAAAVVLLAGAGATGLTRVLDDGSGSRTSAADSATSADAGGSANAPALPSAVPAPTTSSPTSSTTGEDAASLGLQYASTAGVVALTTADFARQAAALDLAGPQLSYRSGAGADEASPTRPQDLAGKTDQRTAAGAARSCTGPSVPGTTSYPVVLDGRPAVLVVHPSRAGGRLVQVWSCDGSRVLVATTVPS